MAGREGGAPIEAGLIARALGGVRYLLSGNPNEFFGPGQPLSPQAQETAQGRQFDYPFAVNTQIQPRATEAIDFPTLRALADAYDLVRLAIETRKDQMGKLRWTVQRKDGGKQDATAKAIELFLQEPDREHDFLTWKRQLIEDLLVIDAPTVYVRRTKGGQPFSFDVVDGATIKRVLDGTGRTPQPPDPAYQQILKGLPAVDYSRDELLYQPRNPRPHKVYGYSPVEQLIATVNIALRRQVHQLQYYTEGNIPDMFASVPSTWTPAQIREFQNYWDELLRGDSAARRRVKFIPDLKVQPVQQQDLFDLYDEWLARVVSYAFNLPPTAFVKQSNRATAENAQDVALEEGLSPLMEWDVRFMNRLIRLGWQTTDYEFAWVKDLDVDPLIQAQIDEIYARNKVRRVNEIRADHGWEADAELDTAQMTPPPSPFGDPASGKPGGGKPGAKDDTTAAPKADDSETKKLVATVLEKLSAVDAQLLELAREPEAPIAVRAAAYAQLVENSVPPNVALKLAGLEAEAIEGGDVAMVSASRIPLSLAADPAGFAPPVEKVEKRDPAPPAPIIVTPVAAAAPNIEVRPEIHIHEAPRGGESAVRITKANGDVVTGTISHRPTEET